MRILLLGYGKMGKTIEELAQSGGHEIVGRIDNTNEPRDLFSKDNTDVAIEFSQPDAAIENIKWCIKKGIPVVSGTTGWLSHKQDIDEYCREKEGTFFYASNFSIGVNLFFKLNKYLAKMMDGYDNYLVSMEETHHTEKKDAPSGTAITLAEGIIEQMQRIKRHVEGTGNSAAELGIKSFREPDVPGTHVVRYTGDEDEIEIRHTAHSRKGFALGAIKVAEWVMHQKGVLTMDDFMDREN